MALSWFGCFKKRGSPARAFSPIALSIAGLLRRHRFGSAQAPAKFDPPPPVAPPTKLALEFSKVLALSDSG